LILRKFSKILLFSALLTSELLLANDSAKITISPVINPGECLVQGYSQSSNANKYLVLKISEVENSDLAKKQGIQCSDEIKGRFENVTICQIFCNPYEPIEQ
jgi:hypothetical protein